jgi:hypothetical protein
MQRFLTPPQIAKILGVDSNKVLAFIQRGELRAFNSSFGQRCRWKVDPKDFELFLESRSNAKPAPPKRPTKIPTPSKQYV